MKKVDIMSQSPNNFIFQKESNETTFGGILSLIYFIGCLLIFLAYLIDTLMNSPFDITSFISREVVIVNENLSQKFYQSEKYNPTLKLSFSLLGQLGQNLSDSFILFDLFKKEPIPRDTIISKRVNDLQIGVFYKCPNNQSNCQIEKKDVNAYDILVLYYHSFDFNPQNITPITPVKKKNMNYEVFISIPKSK